MSHLRTLQSYRARGQGAVADRQNAPGIAAHGIQFIVVATILVAALMAARPSFARGTPDGFADLAEQLLPAVVNISSEHTVKRSGATAEDLFDRFGKGGEEHAQRKAQSLGSGFIIDGKEGIVITNNHVVEDADDVKVIMHDDSVYEAEVVGTDPSTDVAVLRIKPNGKTLPQVPWGDSDKARVGDWVVAIGNPLGLGGTVTAGIISARGRNIQSGPYDDYIQTDASINRGNSGGPLFNMKGEVVGINTAIFSQTGGSIGIGFSIPSNQAKNVANQILKYGSTRRGWLGVSIQEVTKDIAESLSMENAHGALISAVHKGGPAEAAGFEAGDVIVKFNGHDVKDTRELLRLVAAAPVDGTVDVTVWRNGKMVDLEPTLGQREKIDLAALTDSPQGQSGPDQISELDSIGLKVATLTDSLRQELGIDKASTGVVVAAVEPGSDAEEKDLKRGDVILEVNRKPVNSAEEVVSEVDSVLNSGRSSVLLKVQRGDNTAYKAIRFAR